MKDCLHLLPILFLFISVFTLYLILTFFNILQAFFLAVIIASSISGGIVCYHTLLSEIPLGVQQGFHTFCNNAS